MGLHVIVKSTPAGRVRLRGVFTDAEFFALPLVRSFGAFPVGYAALHFDENPRSVGYGMVMAIPEGPNDAHVALLALERWAKKGRYKLTRLDGDEEFFSSASAADKRARELVAGWRRKSYGHGAGRHTAVQLASMPLHPQDATPETVLVEWQCKLRHRPMGRIKIRRLDARGALALAAEKEAS